MHIAMHRAMCVYAQVNMCTNTTCTPHIHSGGVWAGPVVVQTQGLGLVSDPGLCIGEPGQHLQKLQPVSLVSTAPGEPQSLRRWG